VVSSGGREIVSSGGLAEQISLLAGGVLTDLGAVRISGGGTLAGSISGGGQITEIGAGDLILSGSDAGFSGAAVISGGMIELAGSHALGTGFVQYVEPSTGSAVLQVDANDQPKEGATYGTTLSNFSGLKEALDLQSVVYRSDAVASVTGSTLTVTEGTRTYTFTLAGSIASAYHVVSDSEGGTEIAPGATASVIAFTQAAASFAPAGAAKTALVSSTAPTAASPFLHATASGGAGHV
jgi:autotransporter-associated beta strand protein